MKELLHYLKKLYFFSGKILLFNLLGLIVVSFLDGMGMLLLIPMLSMSGILSMNFQGYSIWTYLNFFNVFPQGLSIHYILGLHILLVVGQNVIQQKISVKDVHIHQKFINHIKEEIYEKLLQVRWDFYLKTRKSNLINSLTKDIHHVEMGLKIFIQLITNIIFTCIQIGIAFWLSAEISLLVLICGVGLAFFSWKFIKRARELGNGATQSSREYLAGLTENLNGIKEIKTNSIEISRIGWLRSLNQNTLNEQIQYIKLQSYSQLSYKIALALIIASFIFVSINFFHTRPEALIGIILLFSRLWPRFAFIQANLQQLAFAIPAFKALLNLQNEIEVYQETSFSDDTTIAPLQIKEMIECRNVFFKYNAENFKFNLQDINIKIPANCMTAIVGHSGAGKSTLVDIIMGLNLPEKGEVLVDGTTLSDHRLAAFRKTIGFVPQDPFLFNTSIRENLMIMNPNSSEEELWEALRFSAAEEFVNLLPSGLDTEIGDRGIKLSGGERQRLVLARAILKNPAMLVLDEATSALDTDNEGKIQEALDRLKGKMTIIVIAHRLSTIRNADQVIVLEQGRVAQNGGYLELAMDQKGIFGEYLEKQLKVSQSG